MDKVQEDAVFNKILGETIKFHLEIENNFKLYSYRVITPKQFGAFSKEYIMNHFAILDKIRAEAEPLPTDANGQTSIPSDE